MAKLIALLKRLALVLAVTAAAWSSALVTFGVPAAEASCGQIQINVYEDTNQGGDWLPFCYPGSLSNLHTASDPDGCHGVGEFRFNWGDCVSSFRVINADCHFRVLLYANTGYSGLMQWTSWGNKTVSTMGGSNDALSSFRFEWREDCV